ncbi:MAG: ABC transporter ATP-binding protein [Streptosporangiaceae bacterium]
MPTKPDPGPETPPETATVGQAPLLDVRDLEVHFALRGGFLQRVAGHDVGMVKAVDGVSFQLRRGEVLGLVGESGSGKTTLGRSVLGLVPATGGSISLEGRDITGLSDRRFRPLRRRMQMVFQDPHAALNPAMSVAAAVAHPLRIHKLATDAADVDRRVRDALDRVGLAPAERFLDKYPSDLSGGQKQRVVLARAIILGPDLVVADEPVSMLDMSVRAKILDLMLGLRDDLGLTYLYITHDLATAKFFCDRVAIMYLGRLVEVGPAEKIFADPKHPYTQALLRAIPEPDPAKAVPRDLPRGEIPDAVHPPLGCSFHPRCPKAFQVCGWETRDLRLLLEQRWVEAGEAAYDAERSIVGDLDTLDQPGHDVVVPAKQSPDKLLDLLRTIRDEHPDEPLWKGVRRMYAVDGGVRIEFVEGIDPALTQTDGADVACLLYDTAARQRAAELADEARTSA